MKTLKNIGIAVTLPIWWPLDLAIGAVAINLARRSRLAWWYVYGDWREA